MNSVDDFDNEIVEIFAEEVSDVLGLIDEYLPQWQGNPNNEQALKELRRAFHTLKGSGLMVEARDLADVAKAIESLLNMIIANPHRVQPAIFELITEAKLVIPALMKAFINKQAAALSGVNFSRLIEQANDLENGRPVTPLRMESQLSPEFLAHDDGMAPVLTPVNISVSAELPQTNVVSEAAVLALQAELDKMSASIAALTSQLMTGAQELEALKQQFIMQPKPLDVMAVNKQLRNVDQEIQELKYFVKAASEKLAADSVDQQRRIENRLDREVQMINGLSEKVTADLQMQCQQLKAECSNTAKLWAFAAAGFSVVFSIMLAAILS